MTESYSKNQSTLQVLSDTYFELKGRINKTAAEQELFEKTIKTLKEKYPGFLKNIDMHNTSNETMLKLLKQINVEMKKKFLIEAQQAASQDNMKIRQK